MERVQNLGSTRGNHGPEMATSHHPMDLGKRWAYCLLALSWAITGAGEAWGKSLPTQPQATCHITDAATGKALSLVRVSSSSDDWCVWTNEEGVCPLPTQPGGAVLLSCAGYERRTLKAGETAQEVALAPLHEGTAITEEAAAEILHQVAMQMQADLKRHKKVTSEYFIRQDNEVSGSGHLIEGVLSARSAVCLARTKMLSGSHYCGERDCQPLKYSNLHYTLSLGPVARWGDLWNNLCLPLMTRSPRSKHFRYETDYHLECRVMTSSDGSQRLYRITMSHNPRTPALRFVYGTLWVDASTCQPLCFDGEAEGLEMRLHSHTGWRNSPMTARVHIDYACRNGHTEVESMLTQCVCEDVTCTTAIMQAQDKVAPGRVFPNDRANMLNRHVYAREADSGSIPLPMPRTARQEELALRGMKDCAAKTFTRF